MLSLWVLQCPRVLTLEDLLGSEGNCMTGALLLRCLWKVPRGPTLDSTRSLFLVWGRSQHLGRGLPVKHVPSAMKFNQQQLILCQESQRFGAGRESD